MAGAGRSKPHWQTPFALQPDQQFQYFLAEQLHCFVSDIEQMDVIEYQRWGLHFERKARREHEALESSKRRGRR